jgi:AraC-like DNA-binding protein
LRQQRFAGKTLHHDIGLHREVAIRDVARACGFTELSPFYRAFRRWQGGTPQGYRATC